MEKTPETRLSLIGRLSDPKDHQAWIEFVDIYQPLIEAFAVRKGLQHADAIEVTQEVLHSVADAVESWDPDRSKGTFRGWLFRITRNVSVSRLRKNSRAKENAVVDWDQIPAPSAEESGEFRLAYERQLFHWAANKVKPNFSDSNWQAFWLTAVEHHTADKVSEELGISQSQVYVARSRVISRISKVVQTRLNETLEDGNE